jgi:putative Mg2+ transporter-C (MgtC) family protein
MNPIVFFNMTLAALIGAAVGFERQWYQGMAGLRTNTLVAFGAASFVALEVPQAEAMIVSGIGFLGAGIIFREGASVRGLNTAATLWCSAAAGALSGTAHYREAVFCGAGVVAINLGLRYIQVAINRYRPQPVDVETDYLIEIDCAAEDDAKIRALLAAGVGGQNGLGLRSLRSRKPSHHGGAVRISADFVAHQRVDEAIEQLVGRIGLEKRVISARWSAPSLSSPAGRRVDD